MTKESLELKLINYEEIIRKSLEFHKFQEYTDCDTSETSEYIEKYRHLLKTASKTRKALDADELNEAECFLAFIRGALYALKGYDAG